MNIAQAETVALSALGFLAADSEIIGGFLAASGAGPADLRQRASDPDFLGFVLDYLMGNEDLARPFCQAQGLSAEKLHAARAALPGGSNPDWT